MEAREKKIRRSAIREEKKKKGRKSLARGRGDIAGDERHKVGGLIQTYVGAAGKGKQTEIDRTWTPGENKVWAMFQQPNPVNLRRRANFESEMPL